MEPREDQMAGDFGPQRSGPPWEDKDAGDLFQRFWKTIVQGVTEPHKLFEQMRISGGLLQPLLFYVAVLGLALFVSLAMELPFQFMLGGTVSQQLPVLSLGVVYGLFFLFLLPILLPLGLLIGSGLTHLGLMVFGGANQPYEATLRVNAYAFGSVGWTWAIPFCGSMIGGIWGIVLEIIGIANVHEISTGKAAAAVLVPLVVISILGFCLVAAFGVALFGLIASGT